MRKHAARLMTILLAMTVALTLGCKKDGEGGGEGGGAAESGPQKLGKLPLQADLPAGAQISDAPLGEGVMIQGEGVTMTIEVADDSTPKTLEAAKEDADMYGPKNIREEKLADGYALSFENEGGAGTTYWLKARREIDGKAYVCSVTSPYAEHATNALAICKSLTK